MKRLTSVMFAMVVVLAATCARDASVEIGGTVSYLQRIALPPVAIARVYIVPIGSSGVPGAELAEFVSEPPFRNAMPFQLKLDAASIGNAPRYQLRGEILVDQQLMFFGSQELDRNSGDWPAQVELILDPVQ